MVDLDTQKQTGLGPAFSWSLPSKASNMSALYLKKNYISKYLFILRTQTYDTTCYPKESYMQIMETTVI